MNPKINGMLFILALVGVGLGMSVFVVDQREHAIKFQFGEIIDSDYDAGLHFKIPFVQNVEKYPNLILTDDDPTQEKFLTGEKKNLIVDYYVTWRIADPARYYQAVRGDEGRATERLAAVVKEGIKAQISRRTVQEVVAAERSELMDDMLRAVKSRSPDLGIEVIDVRVMRIDLSEEVSDSVFSRMREERQRTAAQLRAEGEEEAERKRAEADYLATVIRSEARRDAEIVRGDGDAQAAAIYADAYSQDSDFYAFYRSMVAYRQAIGGSNDVLVLQPDSEFFRYLQNQSGAEAVAD
jgi:modulator of FtsH protease HflC